MTTTNAKRAILAATALVALATGLGTASQAAAGSFEYRSVNVPQGQNRPVRLDGATTAGATLFLTIKQPSRTGAAPDFVEVILPRGCHVVEGGEAVDLTISHDGGRTFAPLSEEPSDALRLPAGVEAVHMRLRTPAAQPGHGGEVLIVAQAD